jgi:hypothetical protein
LLSDATRTARYAEDPAFVEMTSWFVADLERTGTPYMFVALNDRQCEWVERVIDDAMVGEGWHLSLT